MPKRALPSTRAGMSARHPACPSTPPRCVGGTGARGGASFMTASTSAPKGRRSPPCTRTTVPCSMRRPSSGTCHCRGGGARQHVAPLRRQGPHGGQSLKPMLPKVVMPAACSARKLAPRARRPVRSGREQQVQLLDHDLPTAVCVPCPSCVTVVTTLARQPGPATTGQRAAGRPRATASVAAPQQPGATSHRQASTCRRVSAALMLRPRGRLDGRTHAGVGAAAAQVGDSGVNLTSVGCGVSRSSAAAAIQHARLAVANCGTWCAIQARCRRGAAVGRKADRDDLAAGHAWAGIEAAAHRLAVHMRVQAPHGPAPQTNLVPVSLSSSRKATAVGVRVQRPGAGAGRLICSGDRHRRG